MKQSASIHSAIRLASDILDKQTIQASGYLAINAMVVGNHHGNCGLHRPSAITLILGVKRQRRRDIMTEDEQYEKLIKLQQYEHVENMLDNLSVPNSINGQHLTLFSRVGLALELVHKGEISPNNFSWPTAFLEAV